MAELPCSVPLSKKHIYDGLFSSPAPPKQRTESSFSFRIDDYREIFSPSQLSLGLSIPILDLPDVHHTDTSTVDYAGVFGGVADDHRDEAQLLRKSKRKSKRDPRPSRGSTQTIIPPTKSQELSSNSGNHQSSTSPAKTEVPPSKGEESTSVLVHQCCDVVKDFDDSHDETNEPSKGGTDGMSNIASLHSVPEHTPTIKIDEISPAREAGLLQAELMSTAKLANDDDAGLQKEFERDKCGTFEASHITQRADCVPQTYSVSTLSSSPKLFSNSNDSFRRSSSQRSKSLKNNQRSSAAADPSLLLDEELDVNSAAAVSAAAMKRAIEEAEAKIRSAKEIWRGKEMDGSGRLSFKNSFNFNAASSEAKHSYAACELKAKDFSNVEATMQNESVSKDQVIEQKNDLKTKSRPDGQFEDEAGVAMNKHIDRSTCGPETIEGTHESSHPPEYVNDADLEGKTYSQEVLISTDTSHKHEGVKEWEATKHLSQLFTGVKNRFVSFISKQPDAEKTVLQKNESSVSGSLGQPERRAYQEQDADADISATDQDQLENDVQINGVVSSEVGDSAQDSERVSLEIHKLEEIVEEATVSSGVTVPSTGQSNLSGPEKELNREEMQEFVEFEHKLTQKDEKGQMDSSELEQHGMNLDTTYQARRYGPEDINCEENNEEEEQLQDQGAVEEEEYESFDDEDGIWRQEEGCNSEDTEILDNCEQKLQDIEIAEDNHKERVETSSNEYSESFDFQDVKSKATADLIEVIDDTYEQDYVNENGADNAHERVVCSDNVCEHYESVLPSKSKEAYLHVERSLNPQLMELSSGVEERMTNLATRPIKHKLNQELSVIEPNVNNEQPVIESNENDGQPQIETKVNDEQPEIETMVTDEQPIIEPKLNDEQPVIEPNLTHTQPIMEPKVNDEQPKIEPEGKDEQLIIEPKVNDVHPIIVPKVTDKQQIMAPKVNDEKPIIEPKVLDEQPNIEPGVTEQLVIKPKVNDKQPIIESKMNDELIIEPKINDEQPMLPIHEPKMPIITPNVTHEQPITEPKGNSEQLITEPKVNHEQPIIEAKVNDEQPITVPKVNIEQPISSEVSNQLFTEDIIEQPKCSSEVTDNFPEQDHYFNAADYSSEQDKNSSLSRTGACGYDDGNKCSQDVDFTCKKERMADSTSTASETNGNLEQPRFVNTINELMGKEMLEPTSCSIEVANETLDHNECPPRSDYACMLEDHSNSEDYGHTDRKHCGHNLEFCFEDDMSNAECNVEQSSCEQIATSLIGKNMSGTSAAAGDSGEIEEEIEDTREVFSHTNSLKAQPETDLNFEQTRVDEETFITNIGQENQVDESLFRTDMEEVYMASDQDKTMSDVETSNKRKRWFEMDNLRDLYQCDILLGDEIEYEVVEILDNETVSESGEGTNASQDGSCSGLEDGIDSEVVEIIGNEKVSESGECTNASQDGSCGGLEDGYSTEPSQHRRRWFQNRGEEVMHEPSYVAGMTTNMDDEIAQESELDNTLQDCAHNLVTYRKNIADVECNVASDQAPRRRRWFENRQKSGPAQKPSILVDNVINADRKDIEQGVDAAINDEAGKKATTGVFVDRVAQKEKERKVVDRAIRAARLRAFVEARGRAAMDAKLKVEHAAVERATAEARERALHKAMSEKAAYERDLNNQTSVPSFTKGYSSAPFAAEKSRGGTSESPRRRKAISERNRRTMERAAKALEEKNLRDSIAYSEQAERDMFADILDGEVKSWLIGKDGNLRLLLSTLQYILGPGSGWQPIPLSDLIDPTSVRKAYKRAALCVHPDKLQQRGATIQQKYLCEKVFDVLKDAWKWHE